MPKTPNTWQDTMNNRFVIAFFSLFLLYLGGHALVGYVKCVSSDWVLCPGQLMDHSGDDDDDDDDDE